MWRRVANSRRHYFQSGRILDGMEFTYLRKQYTDCGAACGIMWRQETFNQHRVSWPSTSSRGFASARNKKRRQDSVKPLANEDLVKVLMSRFDEVSSPDEVEVRLVVDEGPEQPSSVEVTSLSNAIKISVDRMTDLIGIAIDKTPPVIRASSLSSLEYKKQVAASKNKSTGKQKKSLRFKAGIGENDLKRKIADMISYLEKGMDCDFTIFTKARIFRQNDKAGLELIETVQEMVGDAGRLRGEPHINEIGNFVRATMVPTK